MLSLSIFIVKPKCLYINNSDSIINNNDNMKLELKIIDLLNRNKEKQFTMNEIAKSLNQHYSLVHRMLERISKDKIIFKEKVGNSYICRLNKNNEKTAALLALAEIERKEGFYNKNKEIKLILEDLVNSIKENAISIILFGSYAKGKQTEKSDIDILILTEKKFLIGKTLRELYAKYGREINPIILTLEELKQQKDENFVKEVISNHYILYGVEIFSKEMLNG